MERSPDTAADGGRDVALSAEKSWAGLVRRGPSIVRRLRLASGLVLFSYVFLHFLNHSLGNISWQAMEQGAVAVHLSLAFWALYSRRDLWIGWIEALRLGLGFLIPVLVVQHAVGVRLAY